MAKPATPDLRNYVHNRGTGDRAALLTARVKLVFAAAIALTLGACTTVRYVPTDCVAKDQILPAEPEKVADKLTGKADEDLRIVSGSALRLRAWGQGLLGIVEGCRAK